jgi:hypothetical protein
MKEYKAAYELSPVVLPDRQDALQMHAANLEFYFKAQNGNSAIRKAKEIERTLGEIPYARVKLEELVEIKDVHFSG